MAGLEIFVYLILPTSAKICNLIEIKNKRSKNKGVVFLDVLNIVGFCLVNYRELC